VILWALLALDLYVCPSAVKWQIICTTYVFFTLVLINICLKGKSGKLFQWTMIAQY
jgi:hypothetical protein